MLMLQKRVKVEIENGLTYYVHEYLFICHALTNRLSKGEILLLILHDFLLIK